MQKEIKTSHLSTKMKKIGYFHIGLAMFLGCMTASAEQTMTFFDDVVFYDGYNETIFGADENDGVLRHRNSLYAVKMTDEQLDAFGETTEMNVTIRRRRRGTHRAGTLHHAVHELSQAAEPCAIFLPGRLSHTPVPRHGNAREIRLLA